MSKLVESAIQRALISWLTTAYPSKLKWAANNNEHARNYLAMGVDVGSTDLLIRLRKEEITYFLYLEIKKIKGKLSPSQIDWNEDFDENYASSNCQRAVAYGYHQAIAIIKIWASSLALDAVQSDLSHQFVIGYSNDCDKE